MINNRLIINIFILKTITIILDIGVTFVFPFGLVAMAWLLWPAHAQMCSVARMFVVDNNVTFPVSFL